MTQRQSQAKEFEPPVPEGESIMTGKGVSGQLEREAEASHLLPQSRSRGSDLEVGETISSQSDGFLHPTTSPNSATEGPGARTLDPG